MKSVSGKVAFITGGSSGVGLGILRVLSEAGMRVAFTYRQDAHLESAMKYFKNKQCEILPIKLDVTDRIKMLQAANEVESIYGSVDLLVNNAGVNISAPMDEATYDDWDWLIDVNLKGTINGLVTFLPRMKQSGKGGHIVNTGSIGAFISGPDYGIYTTTKFAIRGLTESLRYCLAKHNIGVSLLCPGLVSSNICNSDEHRSSLYPKRGHIRDEETLEQMNAIQAKGMDPFEVGKMTLDGIMANAPYIFTHNEHREELRELFEETASYIPEGEINILRSEIENSRRNRFNDIRRQILKMEH